MSHHLTAIPSTIASFCHKHPDVIKVFALPLSVLATIGVTRSGIIKPERAWICDARTTWPGIISAMFVNAVVLSLIQSYVQNYWFHWCDSDYKAAKQKADDEAEKERIEENELKAQEERYNAALKEIEEIQYNLHQNYKELEKNDRAEKGQLKDQVKIQDEKAKKADSAWTAKRAYVQDLLAKFCAYIATPDKDAAFHLERLKGLDQTLVDQHKKEFSTHKDSVCETLEECAQDIAKEYRGLQGTLAGTVLDELTTQNQTIDDLNERKESKTNIVKGKKDALLKLETEYGEVLTLQMRLDKFRTHEQQLEQQSKDNEYPVQMEISIIGARANIKALTEEINVLDNGFEREPTELKEQLETFRVAEEKQFFRSCIGMGYEGLAVLQAEKNRELRDLQDKKEIANKYLEQFFKDVFKKIQEWKKSDIEDLLDWKNSLLLLKDAVTQEQKASTTPNRPYYYRSYAVTSKSVPQNKKPYYITKLALIDSCIVRIDEVLEKIFKKDEDARKITPRIIQKKQFHLNFPEWDTAKDFEDADFEGDKLYDKYHKQNFSPIEEKYKVIDNIIDSIKTLSLNKPFTENVDDATLTDLLIKIWTHHDPNEVQPFQGHIKHHKSTTLSLVKEIEIIDKQIVWRSNRKESLGDDLKKQSDELVENEKLFNSQRSAYFSNENQLRETREELKKLEQQKAVIESTKDTFETKMSKLSVEIKTLKARIKTEEEEIDRIGQSIALEEQKKSVLIEKQTYVNNLLNKNAGLDAFGQYAKLHKEHLELHIASEENKVQVSERNQDYDKKRVECGETKASLRSDQEVKLNNLPEEQHLLFKAKIKLQTAHLKELRYKIHCAIKNMFLSGQTYYDHKNSSNRLKWDSCTREVLDLKLNLALEKRKIYDALNFHTQGKADDPIYLAAEASKLKYELAMHRRLRFELEMNWRYSNDDEKREETLKKEEIPKRDKILNSLFQEEVLTWKYYHAKIKTNQQLSINYEAQAKRKIVSLIIERMLKTIMRRKGDMEAMKYNKAKNIYLEIKNFVDRSETEIKNANFKVDSLDFGKFYVDLKGHLDKAATPVLHESAFFLDMKSYTTGEQLQFFQSKIELFMLLSQKRFKHEDPAVYYDKLDTDRNYKNTKKLEVQQRGSNVIRTKMDTEKAKALVPRAPQKTNKREIQISPWIDFINKWKLERVVYAGQVGFLFYLYYNGFPQRLFQSWNIGVLTYDSGMNIFKISSVVFLCLQSTYFRKEPEGAFATLQELYRCGLENPMHRDS